MKPFHLIITFLFISFTTSSYVFAIEPTNCKIWDFIPQYEKYYPCVWNKEIVSWRDKSNAHSAVFKCRNVPTTATYSYDTMIIGTNTAIPYSVSLWATNNPFVIDVTDVNLFNNFNSWANLGSGNRAGASPQCINNPDCLTSSNLPHTLTTFALGNNVGISTTTTYNMFILNENPASYSQYPADDTDAIQNCFALQVNVSII